MNILFVGLCVAWEVDGEIPDEDAPPSAPNTKNASAQAALEKLVQDRLVANLLAKNSAATDAEVTRVRRATMNRSLRRHYDTVVEFSASVRILASRSISPDEVRRGCAALSRSFQSWARMGCHLTSYFHLAMHMEPQFLKWGPCYGWWVFAYERNNGWLGRTNNNGHSGGELEATMMRRWWKVIFIQDLVRATLVKFIFIVYSCIRQLTHLESLPDPAPEDLDSIDLLKKHLQGGTNERGGTLQNYMARMAAENNPRE